MKKGIKVKVHLGIIGSCYGITTGKTCKKYVSKKKREIDILELEVCEPFAITSSQEDLCREGMEVSFNTRFANQVRVFKDESEVYPTPEQLNYYKLKKKLNFE